jgi:hypothetical protein
MFRADREANRFPPSFRRLGQLNPQIPKRLLEANRAPADAAVRGASSTFPFLRLAISSKRLSGRDLLRSGRFGPCRANDAPLGGPKRSIRKQADKGRRNYGRKPARGIGTVHG